MKKALTLKLMAIAAALAIMTSLTGCFGAPADKEETGDQPAVSTSAADVSGSDVSGTDVSGTDVSGTDVSGSDVVDDATAADNAIQAYLDGFNTGDAAKLADVTCSPAMLSFLEKNGQTKEYVAGSFAASIENMKTISGGNYVIVYDYTAAEATAEQLDALKAEVEALSAGCGEKVQAVRIYQVNMNASAVASASDITSSGDIVSGADVTQLDQSQTQLRLYKYDGKWYVFGV